MKIFNRELADFENEPELKEDKAYCPEDSIDFEIYVDTKGKRDIIVSILTQENYKFSTEEVKTTVRENSQFAEDMNGLIVDGVIDEYLRHENDDIYYCYKISDQWLPKIQEYLVYQALNQGIITTEEEENQMLKDAERLVKVNQ